MAGAYARLPLCDRIPKLDCRIPVDYIYGQWDWMKYEHALDVRYCTQPTTLTLLNWPQRCPRSDIFAQCSSARITHSCGSDQLPEGRHQSAVILVAEAGHNVMVSTVCIPCSIACIVHTVLCDIACILHTVCTGRQPLRASRGHPNDFSSASDWSSV